MPEQSVSGLIYRIRGGILVFCSHYTGQRVLAGTPLGNGDFFGANFSAWMVLLITTSAFG